MESTALQPQDQMMGAAVGDARPAAGTGAGFFLFILVNATLFIRPSELINSLERLQIYLVLIAACMAVSLPVLLEQLRWSRLVRNPLTLCVVGLLPAVVLSHVVHFQFGKAVAGGIEFAKVLIYYLLLVGLVDSPRRLRTLLFWMSVFITVLAAVPLAQTRGIIHIPDLAPILDRAVDHTTGRAVAVTRLLGIGIFADPNDLCHIIAVGAMICLYWLTDRSSGWKRFVWMGPLALFLYATVLTRSRGGFIALMIGLAALSVTRFGWRRTALLGAVVLPAVFSLLSGRQTDISTDADSARSRLILWSDAIYALRHHPVFGVGEGNFVEEAGQVAHNSFAQAFAELGFPGGLLFLGAFYVGYLQLHRLRPGAVQVLDPEMRRLRPFLAAAVAAYIGGMLSLTRTYAVPTYMVLALAAAYLRIVHTWPPTLMPRFNLKLLMRMAAVSVLFLVAMYALVRVSIRWT